MTRRPRPGSCQAVATRKHQLHARIGTGVSGSIARPHGTSARRTTILAEGSTPMIVRGAGRVNADVIGTRQQMQHAGFDGSFDGCAGQLVSSTQQQHSVVDPPIRPRIAPASDLAGIAAIRMTASSRASITRIASRTNELCRGMPSGSTPAGAVFLDSEADQAGCSAFFLRSSAAYLVRRSALRRRVLNRPPISGPSSCPTNCRATSSAASPIR